MKAAKIGSADALVVAPTRRRLRCTNSAPDISPDTLSQSAAVRETFSERGSRSFAETVSQAAGGIVPPLDVSVTHESAFNSRSIYCGVN